MSLPGNLDPETAAARTWEVVVVGAGPSGAFAAHQLAAAGLQVLLIEKQRFPRYKVCGCCLGAQAVASLQTAGLAPVLDQIGAKSLHNFMLACHGHAAQFALPAGRTVSRAAFDAALVSAAMANGACFLPECQAILGNAGNGQRRIILEHAQERFEIAARIVVGADGLAGSLRKNFPALAATSGRDSYLGAGTMITARSSFYRPGTIYMACGRSGYAGVVQVENDQLVIAAALAPDFIRRAGTLAQAAEEVLHEAGFPLIPELHAAAWKGTPALTRRAVQVSAERFFILGDAGGYVEPFTGEGMTWALAAAAALAPLVQLGVRQWSPAVAEEWQRVQRRIVGQRQKLCRVLARALRHPALIEIVIRLAEKNWLSLAPLANYLHMSKPVWNRLTSKPGIF